MISSLRRCVLVIISIIIDTVGSAGALNFSVDIILKTGNSTGVERNIDMLFLFNYKTFINTIPLKHFCILEQQI